MTAPGDGDREEVNDPSVEEPTESHIAEGDAPDVHEPDATEGEPAAAAGEAGTAEHTAASDELAVTQMELAERTADLQRLQAEFLNYKRRVERDRELLAQNAAYKVLTPVIEVLDTIDRAKEHGPLEGGFKAVADQLERVVGAQGLTRFGEPGDAFDPNLHEALSHLGTDADVTVQTVKVVAKAGYRMGDRVVRAAQVLVVDPED
ncbi:molecular chaperone GrpE [Nocardioides zeae]|uniref:Molecular chaperone GrpE n=1 Tax=Nocardioides zeae TaxID=1457234 RepID=A0ACC6IJP9_9ACTN|nr:nucleotide exchange factor GrpE [Nocardioides zeae]MDR6174741.1 molecular chaperone GrpE [Nocardioides zeae]MDR6210810.1 molecular chaperone GrpE [Nocardioides zeae]